MIACLFVGKLHEAAQRLIGRESGKPYVKATLTTVADDGRQFIRVSAFQPEPIEALLRLAVGDAVSIAGTVKFRAYVAKSGEPAVGVDVVADKVMTAYEAGRLRKASRPAPRPEFDDPLEEVDHAR